MSSLGSDSLRDDSSVSSFEPPMRSNYATTQSFKDFLSIPNANLACDHSIKIIVVGPSGVGKSCLIYTFSEREFLSQHDMTVGVEFAIRLVNLEGKSVKLQIWDTAGQESFRSVTSNYYRGSAGALLVYDITRRDTFLHLDSWLRELQAHCDPVTMVVGNKADMAEDIRQVSSEEGQLFATQNGLLFYEVSAKDVEKVEEIFMTVAKGAFSQIANSPMPDGNPTSISVVPPQQNKKESKCCG